MRADSGWQSYVLVGNRATRVRVSQPDVLRCACLRVLTKQLAHLFRTFPFTVKISCSLVCEAQSSQHA